MNQLQLHSAEEAAQRAMDDLLVSASAEGNYVTGEPGHVLLYVRNRLRRKSRTLTVSWSLLSQSTVSVGAGKTLILGPFGLADLHGRLVAMDEIRVEVTCPKPRGLRLCAIVPPTGQTITTTSPVFEFGIPRPR